MPNTAAYLLPILGLAAGAAAGTGVSCTPHDSYSSSVGVLGCKVNTNRIAYWPGTVDCSKICIKLTYNDRSVNLLRVDSSQGAHDISYDAYAYLQTGKSAVEDPISGGGVPMEYEEVDASECADLIYTEGSKLPLSAANSMNFLAACLAEEGSWVAQNHVLYNVQDPTCTLGYDEVCTLDLAVSNQASCSHGLGANSAMKSSPVYNIEYGTGNIVIAGSNAAAPAGSGIPVEAGQTAPAPATPSSTTSTSSTTTSTSSSTTTTTTSSSTTPAPEVHPTPSTQTTHSTGIIFHESSTTSSLTSTTTATEHAPSAAANDHDQEADESSTSTITQSSSRAMQTASYPNGTATYPFTVGGSSSTLSRSTTSSSSSPSGSATITTSAGEATRQVRVWTLVSALLVGAMMRVL